MTTIELLINNVIQDNQKTIDWPLRRHASAELVKIGQAAVAPLIELLNNQKSRVRAEAANTLGRIGSVDAVDPLIITLNDQVLYVVTVACEALGNIRDTRAIAPLISLLHRNGYDSTVTAVQALEKIGALEALPILMELALSAPYTETRDAAVRALGCIGDAFVNNTLIQSLNDREESVRITAAEVLAHFSHLYSDASAVQALDERIAYYINRLQTKSKDERKTAISALGRIGNARAVKPLVQHLESDPDKDVQASAALALGQIGDKSAVEPLILALQDEVSTVRDFAAYSLGMIGNKKAILPLTKLLQESNGNVGLEVTHALEKLEGHLV